METETKKGERTGEKYLIAAAKLGLFNRITFWASMYAWAKLCKRQLVLIWEKDSETDCAFDKLFGIENPGEIKISSENFVTSPGIETAPMAAYKITTYKKKVRGDTENYGSAAAMIADLVVFPQLNTTSGVAHASTLSSSKQLFDVCMSDEEIFYWSDQSALVPPENESHSFEDFEKSYKEFHSKLTLNAPVAVKVEDCKKELLSHTECKNWYGLHYRSHKTETAQFIGTELAPMETQKELNDFASEIKELNTKTKDNCFFLASDIGPEEFLKNLSTSVPPVPPSIKIFSCKIPEDDWKYRGRSCEGLEFAIRDWKMLASTQIIIGNKGSTLSDSAAATPGGKIPIGAAPKYTRGNWGGVISWKKILAAADNFLKSIKTDSFPSTEELKNLYVKYREITRALEIETHPSFHLKFADKFLDMVTVSEKKPLPKTGPSSESGPLFSLTKKDYDSISQNCLSVKYMELLPNYKLVCDILYEVQRYLIDDKQNTESKKLSIEKATGGKESNLLSFFESLQKSWSPTK